VLPQAQGAMAMEAHTQNHRRIPRGAIPQTYADGVWRIAIATMARDVRRGTTSPVICVVMAAASRRIMGGRSGRLKCPQPLVQPGFGHHQGWRNCAGLAPSSRSAALFSLARAGRSDPAPDQAGKALGGGLRPPAMASLHLRRLPAWGRYFLRTADSGD